MELISKAIHAFETDRDSETLYGFDMKPEDYKPLYNDSYTFKDPQGNEMVRVYTFLDPGKNGTFDLSKLLDTVFAVSIDPCEMEHGKTYAILVSDGTSEIYGGSVSRESPTQWILRGLPLFPFTCFYTAIKIVLRESPTQNVFTPSRIKVHGILHKRCVDPELSVAPLRMPNKTKDFHMKVDEHTFVHHSHGFFAMIDINNGNPLDPFTCRPPLKESLKGSRFRSGNKRKRSEEEEPQFTVPPKRTAA